LLVAANPAIARGAGHDEPRVGALGAAEGEVDQLRAADGQHAAGGLGRHRGLERHMVEQHRLGQLRFGDQGGHLQQRLAGEDNAALGGPPARPR